MTQADAEAEDYLKLTIFGSEHQCQDLGVSPHRVPKASTFRRAQGNTDLQLEEKSHLSWKSSSFKQWRYQFSNKSQREIYVYQCEKPVQYKQKTHKGERKLTQKKQHP